MNTVLRPFVRPLFVALWLAGPLTAAPPSVTTLTPGGGPRGSTVAIMASGTFETWPVEVWSSSPGVTAKAQKEKGKFTITVAADAPLGVTWLRSHDATGASQLRPFIVGGLPEVAEIEPNDEPKTATPVAVPAVVNGKLAKSGDVDCFAVKLRKGQTLVASLDAHKSLRSPMDAVLQLVSVEGVVLEQNHDYHGLDPQLAHTATADGTFVVRLFAFPSQPDSTIRHFGSDACVYRLTLTTEEFVDFVTPLAVERDREATVTPHGWNLKAATAKLGLAETHFGIAYPFPVRREPHACFDLTAAATDTPLSPPFTATGRVSKAGMPSVVPFAGKAGKPLSFRLESSTLGLSLTPVLKVVDATGKQLLRVEPAALNGDIDAAFTPPADGTYRAEVHDLLRTAGPRHVFALRVVPAVPDFEATVAADRYTVAVGTPLDLPITVVRKNGFAGEVVPFVEGLPEDVTFEVVPPAAKPDPKTVVVRLTAKAAGRGPIRIGLAAKSADKVRKLATAPLADFETTTPHIWLTATAAPPKK